MKFANNIKRIMGLLFCLCLMLSLFLVSALAAEGNEATVTSGGTVTYSGTLSEALSAAESGDTVTLLKNVEAYDLTIQDSSRDKTGRIESSNYIAITDSNGSGKLTLKSGTMMETVESDKTAVVGCGHADNTNPITVNNDGKSHSFTCSSCSENINEAHRFIDNVCEVCNFKTVASVTVGDDTCYYADLPAAIAASETTTEATLKLLADVTVSKTLAVEKGTITLDLNDHSITGGLDKTFMIRQDGGILKIVDKSNSKTGSITNTDGWAIQVFDGEMEVDSVAITGGSYGIYVLSGAELLMKGGSVIATNTNNGIGIGAAGKVIINDSIITGMTYALQPMEGSEVYINGGTLVGKYSLRTGSGSVTLNGGDLRGTTADIHFAGTFIVADDVNTDYTLMMGIPSFQLPLKIAEKSNDSDFGFTGFTYVDAAGTANGNYLFIEGNRKVNGQAMIDGGAADELYLIYCEHETVSIDGLCSGCGTQFAAGVGVKGGTGDGSTDTTYSYYSSVNAALAAVKTTLTGTSSAIYFDIYDDYTGDITIDNGDTSIPVKVDMHGNTLNGELSFTGSGSVISSNIESDGYGVKMLGGRYLSILGSVTIDGATADIYLAEGVTISNSHSDGPFTVAVEDVPSVGERRHVSYSAFADNLTRADNNLILITDATDGLLYLAHPLASVTVKYGAAAVTDGMATYHKDHTLSVTPVCADSSVTFTAGTHYKVEWFKQDDDGKLAGSALASAPGDAGKYDYVITGMGNYSFSYGGAVEIEKSGISKISWNDYTDTMTYDGQSLETPNVTFTMTDTSVKSPTRILWREAGTTEWNSGILPSAVGRYELWAELDATDNYLGSYTTKILTISPATPTIAWSTTSETVTYTGSAAAIAAPTVSLMGNDTFSGTISYAYTGISGGKKVSGSGLPVNAGTYVISASIAEQENYTAAQSITPLALTISKAEAPVITFPTVENEITFGQQLKEAKLSFYENAYGTFNWVVAIGVPSSAGIQDLALDFYPNEMVLINYDWKDTSDAQWIESRSALCTTGRVIVNKADPTYTAPTKLDLSYSGMDQTLVTAGSSADGTMVYSLNKDGVYSEIIPTGKNAGTYNVYYKVICDSNYNDNAGGVVQVTIGKAKLTVAADSKTVYEGEAIPKLTGTVKGLVQGDQMTTAPTFTTNADTDKTGTYTITASGANAGSNYEIVYVDAALLVLAKAPATVEDVTLEDKTALENTRDALEKVLADHVHVLTDDQKKEIQDELQEIENAIKSIVNAETVTEGIVTLPQTVTPGKPSDETAVKEAKDAYDNLTDHEKTLVDEETKAKLDAAIEALAECDGLHDCPSMAFIDVDTSKWYHTAIDYVLRNNIMQGDGTDSFKPDGALTRSMIVQVLYNLEGKPAVTGKDSFTDTEDGAWYSDAVLWASQKGIVEGYGNGKFGPNDTLTREQMATILCRYAEYKGMNTGTKASLKDFTDAGETSSWAEPYIQWAVANGILNGFRDGTLRPTEVASRAQVAQIILNYFRK